MFVVINFDALAQVSVFQIERRIESFLPLLNAGFEPGFWNRLSSRLNARWQTDWAIEDKAKNWNSKAHSYYQPALSPLDNMASWLLHLVLAIYQIYLLVFVNYDAPAQGGDFASGNTEVFFLCWIQDMNQVLCNRISGRLNAHWQTDWIIEDQAKNVNSIARPYCQRPFKPTWSHCRLAFAPDSGNIHICCC